MLVHQSLHGSLKPVFQGMASHIQLQCRRASAHNLKTSCSGKCGDKPEIPTRPSTRAIKPGDDNMIRKCTGIIAGLALLAGWAGQSAEANGYCGAGCFSCCPTAACQTAACYTTCRVERRQCLRTVRETVYDQQ